MVPKFTQLEREVKIANIQLLLIHELMRMSNGDGK